MTEHPSTGAAARDAALLDLGVALGQTHAFGLIAGRCSAAQAEGLRRLREDKLYKRLAETWDEFCRTYLQISKTIEPFVSWKSSAPPISTSRT